MVVIDTDVMLLAYAFHRDPRQEANRRFLEAVQRRSLAMPIYAVMELLGQLSFNLSPQRLGEWPIWLQDRYGLTVLYPDSDRFETEPFFQAEFIAGPFSRMQRHQMPYQDALILNLVERTPDVEEFITWNARHYQGKTAVQVRTPADYSTGTTPR
jgi:hypothetical protein